MNNLMYYLAYGSNIDPQRLADRNIEVSPREKAILPGYKLTFNVKDQFHPNIGYANIVPADSHVEAALYKISSASLTRLSEFEQEYDQIEIEASKEYGVLVQAITFIGKRDWIGKKLKPSTWYLDYFLSQGDFFSDKYFKWLSETETIKQDEQKSLDGVY